MKQRASWLLKIAIMLALLTSLLSGCGNSKVEVNYPLESVSRDGDSTSYIYRAAGQTVPVVAEQLSDQRTPQEMSVQDPERMFLVYDNELIQVQQDPEKPEDTIIEVDSDKYVARNYDSSFLQGYLTASIISNLFNSFGGGYHYGGSYRGYTTYKTYQPTIQYKKPTAQDIKQAPPLTVNKSGSIFKRGTSSSSKRSKDSGSIFNRGSSSSNGSSGTINRGSRSDSSGGGFFSPSRSSKPKTSSGSGKIRKRSRR